ncbi:hypothetical protein LOZ80_03385 [Paenibacillus sp. HWE-109]|uniref:hypothetical protein n=1 Tax=Paenibacillus sp. HWE-109 TaxID=1306526 RepID=UPI001EE07B3F|nr:hypothetical protein [Paenibacillus sp. HWE-109]UKS28000.1 hypothetical protein LOZ80_03385 [Paenibacillus sp. HWE-109]
MTKRRLGVATSVILLIALFFYLAGYKLDAVSAARANSFLPMGYYFNNDDSIKTIGGVLYSDDKGRVATVISVLLSDQKISFLEIGPDGNRIRKKAELNTPITFSWDKSFPWNDFNAKALNEDGKVLYEYRYAKSNYIRHEDLKWYPI